MMSVRQARGSDIPEIVAVINAAFQVEREFRDGDRTSESDLRRAMQTSTFFVAEAEGNIVGAVQVKVTGRTGYFGMLAVDPARQRSGIGRALREAAEDYCRAQGCTEMTLSTGSVRQDLFPYYEKFGYHIVGVEPMPKDAPFTKPIGIVKMSRSL